MAKADTGRALFSSAVEITGLTPASRPRGFVRVRSGATTLALLHPREADALDLKPGRAVVDQLRHDLARAQARSDVRRVAERLLARRALSEAEMVERLAAECADTAAVAEVVASLRRAGAIDDARLAAGAAARSLGRRHAAGAAAAQVEARGLDRATANRAVRAALAESGESDWDRALALARGRVRRQFRTLDVRTQRRRLAGVLARRGFDDELIDRVLDAVLPPTGAEGHAE